MVSPGFKRYRSAHRERQSCAYRMTFPSPGTADVESHATASSNKSHSLPRTVAGLIGRFLPILGILIAVGGPSVALEVGDTDGVGVIVGCVLTSIARLIEMTDPVARYTVTPAIKLTIIKNTVVLWGLGSFIVPQEHVTAQ